MGGARGRWRVGLAHKWGNVWDVHTEQGSVGGGEEVWKCKDEACG
jgi:hypothetical protein